MELEDYILAPDIWRTTNIAAMETIPVPGGDGGCFHYFFQFHHIFPPQGCWTCLPPSSPWAASTKPFPCTPRQSCPARPGAPLSRGKCLYANALFVSFDI